jgi:hypothetical protein
MSRQAGSIVSGEFKAAPDIRQSGPTAGGGCVLRARPKVKAAEPRVIVGSQACWIAGLLDRLHGGLHRLQPALLLCERHRRLLLIAGVGRLAMIFASHYNLRYRPARYQVLIRIKIVFGI